MAVTLISTFLDTVAKHRKPAQFMRKTAGGWESISAERALADVESMALGLGELGIGRGDRVAILSENRYEWPVADLAIVGLGAVSVPIYPTLTAAQCAFVIANSEAKLAIVSSPAQLEKLRSMERDLPLLETIVHMDPVPGRTASARASTRCSSAGAGLAPQPPEPSGPRPSRCDPTTSPPSSTPRARPAIPRAPCSPTATSPSTWMPASRS